MSNKPKTTQPESHPSVSSSVRYYAHPRERSRLLREQKILLEKIEHAEDYLRRLQHRQGLTTQRKSTTIEKWRIERSIRLQEGVIAGLKTGLNSLVPQISPASSRKQRIATRYTSETSFKSL